MCCLLLIFQFLRNQQRCRELAEIIGHRAPIANENNRKSPAKLGTGGGETGVVSRCAGVDFPVGLAPKSFKQPARSGGRNNAALVGDGAVDARQPEALIYEARHGRLRLVGVEFVIIAEVWDTDNEAPPALLGQSFHFTDSPNRFGLPPFYSLHVWAWRNNPHGMFVNWNPRVSCEEFTTVAEQ